MNNTTKYIISAVVAAAMLVSTLAGCSSIIEEMRRSTVVCELKMPDLSDDETTARRDETTADETTAAETTADETTAPEETTGTPETEGGTDGEFPEELKEEMGKYKKYYIDFSEPPEGNVESWMYSSVVVELYHYFDDKEYTVSDFNEIEDCVGVEEIREGYPDFIIPARSLRIDLSSDTRSRALEVIDALLKRSDVYTAYLIESVGDNIPDELREQIIKFGKQYPDLRGPNPGYEENAAYSDIIIVLYPYFNDKEYSLEDFNEIEDCLEVEEHYPYDPFDEGFDSMEEYEKWKEEHGEEEKYSGDSPERMLLVRLSHYIRSESVEVIESLLKRPDVYTAYWDNAMKPQ